MAKPLHCWRVPVRLGVLLRHECSVPGRALTPRYQVRRLPLIYSEPDGPVPGAVERSSVLHFLSRRAMSRADSYRDARLPAGSSCWGACTTFTVKLKAVLIRSARSRAAASDVTSGSSTA